MPLYRNWIGAGLLAVALPAAMLAASPSPNALVPGAGWTSAQDGENEVWRTETRQGATILIQFIPVEAGKQALRPWFDHQVGELATQGTLLHRAGISAEQDLLKDALLLKSDGQTFRIFAFAWPTARGKQGAVVAMYGSVSVKDPTVQQAFELIASAWRQKAALGRDHVIWALAPEGAMRAPKPRQIQRPTVTSRPPSVKPAGAGNGRCHDELRTITTMQLQQVCYPSAGGMSNCQLQSVPVQQQVLQTQCH